MCEKTNNSYEFSIQCSEYGIAVTNCSGNGECAEVPKGIHIISDGLFKGHTELNEVRLPDSLNQVGGFVFDGCINLHEITLPNNLQDMWQYALTRCGIKKLTIPGSLRCIVPFTCYNCYLLETVTIEEGVLDISGFAFKNCILLRDVYIPQSVTTINEHAFDGCPNVILHRD